MNPSTKAFFDEASKTQGYSFLDRLHGYIYARFIYTYIGIGIGRHPVNKIIAPFASIISRIQSLFRQEHPINSSNKPKITVADTYNGKVLPLEAVKQLVSVQQDIQLKNLENIIPYQMAKDIILKHPDHLAVLECPCRSNRENPCLPLDVCMVVGEPFTSFILEHHPKKSRSISRDEALRILDDEDARGHVHHAFFKDAMFGRFYAICNCCACCCGAIQAHEHGTPMLASSGYVALIDHDLCLDCGSCNDYCQFHALSIVEGVNTVNFKLCMGCGICVSKCDVQAISLKIDPVKGIPLEINKLMEEVYYPQ
jgi:NAD-dependent dihydropyrimidine dehydrogenase PreA subunit